MAEKPMFIFLAAYEGEDDAKADYEGLKELHKAGVVGTYDAAIITKDDEGKVHVSKHEKPTQHGAWTGMAVGAVVGLFFPPAVVWEAAVGAGAGGLIGHFWRGLSRSDMKEVGDFLDGNEAALIIIGESKLEEKMEKELKRATKRLEKELTADTKAFNKDLEAAVDEMIKA